MLRVLRFLFSTVLLILAGCMPSTPGPSPAPEQTATPTPLSIPTAITPAATTTPALPSLGPATLPQMQQLARRRFDSIVPPGDLAWTGDGAYLVLPLLFSAEESPLLYWLEVPALIEVPPPIEIRGSHLAFSGDGQMLAVSDSSLGEDRVEIRRSADGQVQQSGEGFFYGIHALAFSPDGRLLAMANGNARARLLDVSSGLIAQELPLPYQGSHPPLLQDVAFSPDGGLVAGAAYGGVVQVWRVADGTAVARVVTDLTQPNAVLFLDSDRFVTNGYRRLSVWRSDGSVLREVRAPDSPIDIALHPEAQLLVAVTPAQIIFFDAETLAVLESRPNPGDAYLARFSPDGSRLALLGRDTLWLWGLQTVP
ncbi:MAG: hypothetical protein D6775_16935 [Caldilineae bacterium]|nr:MAG: hypothetical protein D6775_16935 [Caldilineae bacterium]